MKALLTLLIVFGMTCQFAIGQDLALLDVAPGLKSKNNTASVAPDRVSKNDAYYSSKLSFSYESGEDEICTYAPRLLGSSYKIQFITLPGLKESTTQYQNLSSFGTIYFEYLLNKGLTRLLLGDFKHIGDAEYTLEKVSASGFPHAFIVEYKDGLRLDLK